MVEGREDVSDNEIQTPIYIYKESFSTIFFFFFTVRPSMHNLVLRWRSAEPWDIDTVLSS